MTIVRDPDLTRSRLIAAAFDEIYENGFQGMRVEEILKRTGLKKGALYHHFASKLDIAYAVMDEYIVDMVKDVWINPMSEYEDPIEGITKVVLNIIGGGGDHDYIKNGCPLNNLAQEMSSLDEGFRQRIHNLLQLWIKAFDQNLQRGKKLGYIDKNVDTATASTFIVAILEGSTSLLKASQDENMLQACWLGLESYLISLRPASVKNKEITEKSL